MLKFSISSCGKKLRDFHLFQGCHFLTLLESHQSFKVSCSSNDHYFLDVFFNDFNFIYYVSVRARVLAQFNDDDFPDVYHVVETLYSDLCYLDVDFHFDFDVTEHLEVSNDET